MHPLQRADRDPQEPRPGGRGVLRTGAPERAAADHAGGAVHAVLVPFRGQVSLRTRDVGALRRREDSPRMTMRTRPIATVLTALLAALLAILMLVGAAR